jgi:hypothetical protein
MSCLKTPVLLIVYNRPETTRAVVDSIRSVKPTRLFVFADGWRAPRDEERCLETRQVVADSVDWDCKLSLNYQDHNLGCGPGPSFAITWFFSQVEHGIILEDDCVACPEFFFFCQELLERYASSSKIMHISGTNVEVATQYCSSSYYFSRYPLPWGWATWRRAWEKFDLHLDYWPSTKRANLLRDRFSSDREYKYWSRLWDSIRCERFNDIWDAQWAYACRAHRGLSIVPNTNLIHNIGWGNDATHHKTKQCYLGLPIASLDNPLVHPLSYDHCEEADQNVRQLLFPNVSLIKKCLLRLESHFRRILNVS